VQNPPAPNDGHPAAYWSTSVSKVDGARVYIRGYDLEDLIGNIPFAAGCFLLIKGRIPTPQEAGLLDAVLSAILDYSLYKPGTVAARYVVSANPNMAAGMAAAVLAVGKNTLAPEDTARFILAAYERLEALAIGPKELAREIVAEVRERKERIPGLGHPLFTFVDPRAQLLKQRAVEAGLWGPRAQLYEEIHRAFTELPGKSTIPLNDVGMMAAVLVELGFTAEETTGLAIISTLPGVVAHISEELRDGPPIRIVPDDIAEYPDDEPLDFTTDWRAAGWPDAQ
jgi:citryl-CoA lyase